MPFRVFVAFLAFVLLCSGFAAPGEAMADAGQHVQQAHDLPLGDGRHDPDRSIVEDRADDLPAQLQVENTHDPLLMGPLRPAIDPTLTMALPRPQGSAFLPAPCLEGPQRPPRAPGITA
jgi:hypothetical protein